MIGVGEGVRCFCTEDHCTYGVCESAWCLVGIKESGPVIRTCGNEAARMLEICRRRVGEWLEVCACDTPYCNTFAFLRHQIKHNRFAPSAAAAQPPPPNRAQSPLDADDFASQVMDSKARAEDPDTVTFTVQKAPAHSAYPRRPPETNFEAAADDRSEEVRQDSYLIIVLIIVPLTVGATAVLLVSLNYYCSLC